MKKQFSAALVLAVVILCTSCNRVPWSWPVSRELCGQVQSLNKQTKTILKNTDLVLYRSNSKYWPCCAKAKEVGAFQTDAEGNFNSGKLEAGRYFVVVKNSPEIVFPIFLERDSPGDNCGLNTVFSYDLETGKTEQTVTVFIYKNAQTH